MRRIAVTAALLTIALAGVARAGSLDDVYYERTLMRQAGERCKLFDPKLLLSLEAGALQARGAALRTGESPLQVETVADRAALRASREPCGSPDLHIAAQRVRAAFLGWSRQGALSLPGRGGGWTAQRWPHARQNAWWALAARGALDGRPMMIGLRREGGAVGPMRLAVETTLPNAGGAYVVRLVTRDPTRAPQPYLAADDSPPPGASIGVLAGTKTALNGGGWRFTFPDAAVDALARLDPRESARLELVYAGPAGDRRVSTLVEAGDFAVGRAFLLAGP